MTLPYFTIGHSNRSFDAFAALLQMAGVGLVADIRKLPRSRANPQFNGDALGEALAALQIGYAPFASLGGLRGKREGAPSGLNDGWINRSFRNYADYALTAPFQAGLDALREVGRRRRCAVMCAEAVWWRCHRRIVADYLIARGESVFHIMGEGRLDPARLTPGAEVQPDGTILYPAQRTAAQASA